MVSQPLIGVVVLNYFGGERTMRCLEAVLGSTWPADRLRVVLVDNGSEEGFGAGVAARLPAVKVVRAPRNLGFGGGCNLGVSHLTDCDHIALVNNDALPDPGWLGPLVDTMASDARIGAVTPKVLLDGRFVTVTVRSPTYSPGRGDGRRLGVQLAGARVEGIDVFAGLHLVSGFWGWEHDEVTVGGAFAWTDGCGVIRLPVDRAPDRVELKLACGDRRVTATIDAGSEPVAVDLDHVPTWHAARVGGVPIDVLNNTGTILRADGFAADRGFLEPDGPPFDEPAEVFGWSGAAVLLRRAYLDDLGGFDPTFFLYYEDTDLSWRGRLRGWSYRYAPASEVRHEHSATAGSRSPLVRHLADRNRLLVLTKCAPRRMAMDAVRDVASRLASAAWRDGVVRAAHLEPPVASHVTQLGRVSVGFLRHAPGALQARRRLRAAATASRFDEVATRWAGAPASAVDHA